MNAAEFLATHNPPLVALCVAGRSGAYVYADRALAIEALEEVLRRDPQVDAALAIRGDGDGVIWSPGGRGNWQALGYGAGQLGIGLDPDPTPEIRAHAADSGADERERETRQAVSLRDRLLVLDLGPGASDHERAFVRALADRVNDKLGPRGIGLVVMLLVEDMLRGKSGFPSLPLPPALVGLPPIVYTMLEMSVPGLLRQADAVDLAVALEQDGAP